MFRGQVLGFAGAHGHSELRVFLLGKKKLISLICALKYGGRVYMVTMRSVGNCIPHNRACTFDNTSRDNTCNGRAYKYSVFVSQSFSILLIVLCALL